MLAAPILCRRIRINRLALSFLDVNVKLVGLISNGCRECTDDLDIISDLLNLERRIVINDRSSSNGVNCLDAANARNDGNLIAEDIGRNSTATVLRLCVVNASILNGAAHLANGGV